MVLFIQMMLSFIALNQVLKIQDHRQDESNEDDDIESSLECENTNDIEGKE